MNKKRWILSLVALTFCFITTIGFTKASAAEITDNNGAFDQNNLDSETTVSEVMTFDEIVSLIAEENGISERDAQEAVVGDDVPNLNKAIAKAGSSDDTYRTLTNQFTVDSYYKPSMRFYCKTSESGNFHGIIKILNIDMSRSYNNLSYVYAGSSYTKLENASTIHYQLDGDFYYNGTTTVNGGVDIGIGKGASINFGGSYTTNHYKVVDVSKTFTW